MLNQVIIVGRVVEEPTIKEKEDEKKLCTITLAVPRSYKNVNGEYDVDFIPCILWNAIAQNTVEYVRKGDVVAIKGRIQTNDNQINIIAEKVTFLASKPKED